MNTLQAEIEIVETGEKFTVSGYSIQHLLEKAKQQAGEFVSIAVRAVAVLAVLLTTTAEIPLQTAGQTSAPTCIEYCEAR